MDFRQSNSTPVSRPETGSASTTVQPHGPKKPKLLSGTPGWLNILSVVILFGVAVLLVLMALSFARSNNGASEDKYVDKSKYQAVFLNNGQVYFGNITSLTSNYVRLGNIYYLTQGTTAAANGQQQATSDYTLVKLGCQQIHHPTDQMVINRDQITFWENLSKDGKVAQSIEQFKKQNPNGPNCSQVSSQTQATSNSGAQGSTTPSNTTTNKQ